MTDELQALHLLVVLGALVGDERDLVLVPRDDVDVPVDVLEVDRAVGRQRVGLLEGFGDGRTGGDGQGEQGGEEGGGFHGEIFNH